MQNSFGTFTTLQSEKEFAQHVFWDVVKKEALCVIEDLSREPFQAYCKALELNRKNFHSQAFGYPASEKYFVNLESVKQFHTALSIWQREYNLCFTDENLKPQTFDEYFIHFYGDFFQNIACYILKISEKEIFQKFYKLSDSEKDEIRIKYIQSKKWIFDGRSTADESVAIDYLDTLKASYKSTSKLKHLKSLETNWIPKMACDFLWNWSIKPKDFENLFLSKSYGDCYESVPPPQGLDEFWTLFETPKSYAKRMGNKAQSKLNSDETLSIPAKPRQRQYIEIIEEKALNHAKEVHSEFLRKYPNLSPAKDLPKLGHHFVWLVKTYVLGKQFVDIASEDSSGLDIGNISREVNKLAGILGLPKPAHLKPGRKKESKNNPITSKLGKN